MLDGFKPGRASLPIAGVFDFIRVHGHALSILFVYTVIRAQRFGEGSATSCLNLEWCSFGRTPGRVESC